MVDRERALDLLMGRYRYEEAMRLYGEYCLLLEEDWNDFIAHHSPQRLRQLHRQLAAVGLWPAELLPPPGGTGLLAEAKRAVTGLLGLKSAAPLVPVDPQAANVQVEPSMVAAQETAIGRDPEVVLQSLVAPALSIEMAPDLAQHAAVGAPDSPLHDAIAHARYRLAHDLGFVFPLVHVRESIEVGARTYAVRLNGETVAEGRIHPDFMAAVGPGLPTDWAAEPHPVRQVPISWVTEAVSRAWEGDVQAPCAIVAEHVEDVIRRHAHRLFNNQALDMLLRAYEPEIGKDTLSELFGRFMSMSELRLVLQAMLKQGYGVRNLPKIVDILMSHFINYLAEKPLSMDETWKISSHIPFFSTEELVRVVCAGLGLPSGLDRRAGIHAALERAVRQAGTSGAGPLPGMIPPALDGPLGLPLDSDGPTN